jgi:hypothetical protein
MSEHVDEFNEEGLQVPGAMELELSASTWVLEWRLGFVRDRFGVFVVVGYGYSSKLKAAAIRFGPALMRSLAAGSLCRFRSSLLTLAMEFTA